MDQHRGPATYPPSGAGMARVAAKSGIATASAPITTAALTLHQALSDRDVDKPLVPHRAHSASREAATVLGPAFRAASQPADGVGAITPSAAATVSGRTSSPSTPPSAPLQNAHPGSSKRRAGPGASVRGSVAPGGVELPPGRGRRRTRRRQAREFTAVDSAPVRSGRTPSLTRR